MTAATEEDQVEADLENVLEVVQVVVLDVVLVVSRWCHGYFFVARWVRLVVYWWCVAEEGWTG